MAVAPSDADLVTASRRGERDALEVLLLRHHDRLFSICRRLCGNDADAADATQEALLAIVRGLARYDGRAAFATWAHRVATNAALDELRRRNRRPLPVDDLSTTPLHRPGATGPDLETGAAIRLDVDAALAELPHDFRVAVVLRDTCGLDYAEIADVLHIPPGTVRSRIARGRAHLADLLTGNPTPSGERPTTRP